MAPKTEVDGHGVDINIQKMSSAVQDCSALATANSVDHIDITNCHTHEMKLSSSTQVAQVIPTQSLPTEPSSVNSKAPAVPDVNQVGIDDCHRQYAKPSIPADGHSFDINVQKMYKTVRFRL